MAEFAPARLQLVKEIPFGDGWVYEPKFDGYRGLLVNSEGGKGSLWSRNDKDLGRYFPELAALAQALPRATVLDGEIVMPTATGVSFIALQRRLAQLGRESPVAFIAFDVLRAGADVRGEKLSLRRNRLEAIVAGAGESSLQLMTQTADRRTAEAWLDESLSISGIEGVVAKQDEAYPRPDWKRWKKVRRTSTMDFAVVGFVLETRDAVRLVLAAADGEAGIVGTTYPVSGADMEPLERWIPTATVAERRIWAPFDDGRREWFLLPPEAALFAEVALTGMDAGMLRQPARFVRWRLVRPPD